MAATGWGKKRPSTPAAASPVVVTSPLMLTFSRVFWMFVGFFGAWVVVGGFTGAWTEVAWFLVVVWFLTLFAIYQLWRKRHLDARFKVGLPPEGFFAMQRSIGKAQARRAVVQSRWNRVAENQPKLQGKVSGQKRYARPARLDLTPDGNVAAVIDMSAIGRSVDDLRSCATAIEGVMKCEHLVVREREKGTASVVFQFTDPLETVLPFVDLPAPSTKGNVVVGVTSEDHPYEFPFTLPTLIGGAQGSGKSNAVWDMLGSLVAQGLWVKLYVIDPKGGMELGFLAANLGEWKGRVKIESFATDVTEGRKVIKHAWNDLDMRTKSLAKGGARKLTESSQELPLMILLIDEALDFAADLKDAKSDLQIYTRKARAGLATTWALVQYGHAEELGTGRKLFGNRLCFRAEDETGATLLGPAAVRQGALVSKIPKSTPGVGYGVDDSGEVVRFRAAFVPDQVAKDLALDGKLQKGMGDARAVSEPEHACYRLFDRDGHCLYVGETNNWTRRQGEHQTEKALFGDVDWWGDIDWSNPNTEIRWCRNYREAKALETRWIQKYGPTYNLQENERNLFRKEWKRGRGQQPVQIRNLRPVINTEDLEMPAVSAPSGYFAVYGDDDQVVQGELLDDEPVRRAPAAYGR